jgi:hypothetical protein
MRRIIVLVALVMSAALPTAARACTVGEQVTISAPTFHMGQGVTVSTPSASQSATCTVWANEETYWKESGGAEQREVRVNSILWPLVVNVSPDQYSVGLETGAGRVNVGWWFPRIALANREYPECTGGRTWGWLTYDAYTTRYVGPVEMEGAYPASNPGIDAGGGLCTQEVASMFDHDLRGLSQSVIEEVTVS